MAVLRLLFLLSREGRKEGRCNGRTKFAPSVGRGRRCRVKGYLRLGFFIYSGCLR